MDSNFNHLKGQFKSLDSKPEQAKELKSSDKVRSGPLLPISEIVDKEEDFDRLWQALVTSNYHDYNYYYYYSFSDDLSFYPIEDEKHLNGYYYFLEFGFDEENISAPTFGYRIYADGKIEYFDGKTSEFYRSPKIIKLLRVLGYGVFEENYTNRRGDLLQGEMYPIEYGYEFNFERLDFFDFSFGFDYYYKGKFLYHTGDNGDLMYMPYFYREYRGYISCHYYVYHDFRV